MEFPVPQEFWKLRLVLSLKISLLTQQMWRDSICKALMEREPGAQTCCVKKWFLNSVLCERVGQRLVN